MKHFLGTTTGKVLLSISALGVTAGIAGLGTFATFTSTTSAEQTTATGTMTIALGATGASTNRLTVNATGLVPGDTAQRSFNLSNTGSTNFSAVAMTSAASPSSLLDTDATDGLQMVVDKCSVAWTESGSSPAFTYTCSGTTTTIISSRAIVGSNLSMAGLAALTSSGTDYLRLTLTLPSGAANTFQGLSSTLTYTFTASQVAAGNK